MAAARRAARQSKAQRHTTNECLKMLSGQEQVIVKKSAFSAFFQRHRAIDKSVPKTCLKHLQMKNKPTKSLLASVFEKNVFRLYCPIYFVSISKTNDLHECLLIFSPSFFSDSSWLTKGAVASRDLLQQMISWCQEYRFSTRLREEAFVFLMISTPFEW